MDHTASSTSHDSCFSMPSSTRPRNPYARIPSRRAIACVTCAKAKTKCDKALPACSRCITKGLKCEPRSTRRTSDNNYRTNVKKRSAPPRKHRSTNPSLYFGRQNSSRNMPSSNECGDMRAASHIDLKMGQQATEPSEYPMLTPLPTYSSPINDESYPYSSSPEQSYCGSIQVMEASSFADFNRLSPQTPESIVYHEPKAVRDSMDHYMLQSWPDNALTSVEFGLDSNLMETFPMDMWTTQDTPCWMPATQPLWPQNGFPASSQQIPAQSMTHNASVASFPSTVCSMHDDSCVANPGQWSIYQPTATNMSLANTFNPGALMYDVSLASNKPPMWEDIFVPGSTTY